MPVIDGYWMDDERNYPDEDVAEDALAIACIRYPERAEALQKALAEKTENPTMCELTGEAMDAATATSIKPVNDVFDNVFSVFDAAIERERERRKPAIVAHEPEDAE